MIINNNINEEMKKSHQLSLYALEKMLVLLKLQLERANKIPNDKLALLSQVFLTKFFKTAHATKLIVMSGFEEDARVLLRVLFEILITISYISKEPGTRLQQYCNFYKIEMNRALTILDMHYGTENTIDTTRKEEIKNEYNSIKQDYNKKTSWSDKNYREMAKEINGKGEFWYDIVYNMESSHVHTNFKALNNLYKDIDGANCIMIGPFPFNATEILSKITELSKGMLVETLKNCNFLNEISVVEGCWKECKVLITDEFENKKI